MKLAILDTNVVVSAGVNPEGAPARLVLDWVLRGQVAIVTCPWIVEEYRTVVRRSKFAAYGFPPSWLEPLIDMAMHLPEPERWPYPMPDAKDAPFLALAKAAGAWLVTGNLRHFPEESRDRVMVVSPADYLAHLVEAG